MAEHLDDGMCVCVCMKSAKVDIRVGPSGDAVYRLPPGWGLLDIDIESLCFRCPQCFDKYWEEYKQ